MSIARVVTFEDVDSDHLAANAAQIQDGEPPEGLEASEILILHDEASRKATVIVVFETEEDYVRGDAVLSAMDPADTPGRRASVGRYAVAAHRRL